MSDADDQMGGTGGEHGPEPGERSGPPESKAGQQPGRPAEETNDMEESKDSFPASDPPGNY